VIKQLATDPCEAHYAEELARFKRSGTLRIDHPAVVDPCDFGEDAGEWYQVMPLIEGENLDLYVRKMGGRLQLDPALTIIREVLQAAAAFHPLQIVHRDIKPNNILIDPAGRPHLIDFGICKILTQSTITSGHGTLGTLPWMPPEQIVNPTSADPRADIYAIGAVLYFILTGRPIVLEQSDLVQMVRGICQDPLVLPSTLNPSIPPHVDALCQKALAKRPDERFQTAEEFLQALDGTQISQPVVPLCRVCSHPLQSSTDSFCSHCGSTTVHQLFIPRCLACGMEVGENLICPNCRRPFTKSDHRLVFTYGPAAGLIFRIPQGIFEVGRNQICPRDQYVSNLHFRVVCQNDGIAIADLKSLNKTYVAGQSADRPLMLKSGQELRVAHNVATYTLTFK
jgi:serine/threonine protein kinase